MAGVLGGFKMKVIDMYEIFGDNISLKLVDEEDTELAVYDGKNSIPKSYNNSKVEKAEIIWDEHFVKLYIA